MKKALLGLLLLASPVWAQVPRYTLAEALGRIRMVYPEAEVTGRFSDYRTTSVYRSHAGLHYGYDIALPQGAAVPVPWGGMVVAVTPWGSGQYGFTVLSEDRETTYGHLTPRLHVGDRIGPGTVVGFVAINHVDIKMKDLAGNFVDFGADGGEEAPPIDPMVLMQQEYRQRSVELQTLEDRCEERKRKLLSLQRDRNWLRREEARLGRMAPVAGELVVEGAVSPREGKRIPGNLAALENRLQEIARRTKELQNDELRDLAARLAARQALEDLVLRGCVPSFDDSPKKVAVKSAAPKPAESAAETEADQLYRDGVLSRRELDAARRRSQLTP